MSGYNAAGSLFAGLMQGIMQGRQAQTELQHKKDILKLEQDKIKLQEREGQLRSATDLKTAMMQAETTMRGQKSQERTAGAGDIAAMERMKEQLKVTKEIAGLERTSTEKIAKDKPNQMIDLIEYLVTKGGMTKEEAIGMAVGKDREENMRSAVMRSYITSQAMSGSLDPDEMVRFMKNVDTILGESSNKKFDINDVFKGADIQKFIKPEAGVPAPPLDMSKVRQTVPTLPIFGNYGQLMK